MLSQQDFGSFLIPLEKERSFSLVRSRLIVEHSSSKFSHMIEEAITAVATVDRIATAIVRYLTSPIIEDHRVDVGASKVTMSKHHSVSTRD